MWKADRQEADFPGCGCDYNSADWVILGAPFDSTTSYRPGARFASRAIRGEFYGLELYSPYQRRSLEQAAAFDGGDLELPFGDTARALDQIESAVSGIFSDGKHPVLLGGEHLVTLGALRAAVKRHPDLRIIQFDAHADLREEYLGVSLSHACVIRRAWELVGDGKIHQFGIRSGDGEEFAWGEGRVSTQLFGCEGLSETMDSLCGAPVYLTVDLDVLDPAVFPGTGTPEPGGLAFRELLDAVLAVFRGNIIGFDLCELSPPYDPSGISTMTACKLLREMLLAASHNG